MCQKVPLFLKKQNSANLFYDKVYYLQNLRRKCEICETCEICEILRFRISRGGVYITIKISLTMNYCIALILVDIHLEF